MPERKYRHEDIAAPPRGYRVRTVSQDGHQIRVAFPPGPRRKGSGQLVSILHPLGENPKKCNARETHNPSRRLNLTAILAGATQNEISLVKQKLRKAGIETDIYGSEIRVFDADAEEARRILKTLRRHGKLGGSFVLNPDGNNDSAAALYREFHGRGPKEVLEYQEALLTAGDYTALGELQGLWLDPVPGGDPSRWPAASIEFESQDNVKLAIAPEGSQLYLIGGNQQIALDYLDKAGFDTSKRFITLGEVFAISYATEKSFDDFQTIDYAHEFGEETGERPWAYYDRERRRIVLVGGGYSIAEPTAELGASPGIVN